MASLTGGEAKLLVNLLIGSDRHKVQFRQNLELKQTLLHLLNNPESRLNEEI